MNGLTHLLDPAMFSQPYMQNTLLTGTLVAVLAGIVGVFVVLRGITFAAHSLTQVGFAGAAGAVLIGLDPLWGLLLFCVAGAVVMGLLGVQEHGRDAATALVLAAALGTGALFLALTTTFATAAFSLLFGSIVGISRTQVALTAACTLVCGAALALLYRPLLFATVSPQSAQARGVPLHLLSVLFLVVVAMAAAVTVPVAGTLLIFSLMVGPAATAVLLTRTPAAALCLSTVLGLVATWGGMVLAYTTGWPVGFLIALLVTLLYLGARVIRARPL